MKISRMQIMEILDEVRSISFEKHDTYEGQFVAITSDANGKRVDSEIGFDIGELVNELHSRL